MREMEAKMSPASDVFTLGREYPPEPRPRGWQRISIGFQHRRLQCVMLWSVRRPSFGASALPWLPGTNLAVAGDERECHPPPELPPASSAPTFCPYASTGPRRLEKGVHAGLLGKPAGTRAGGGKEWPEPQAGRLRDPSGENWCWWACLWSWE